MELQEHPEQREYHPNGLLLIRKARIEDYESVRDLESLEFATHHQARPDYFKSLPESYSKAEFEELLAVPCPISWLAVQDGCIIGLCFGKIETTPDTQAFNSRRVAFLQDLVTLPQFRGQGIATALIARAREQSIAEGADSMELCVWNFNEGALRLYKKMGMQIQYVRMEEPLTKGYEK